MPQQSSSATAAGRPYPDDRTFTERYLSGRELWGDDFGPQEIAEWFEDEREGFSSLDSAPTSADNFEYEGLNAHHGFPHLTGRDFPRALGVGSAYGGEFLPVLDRIGEVTILEPSEHLRSPSLRSDSGREIPVRYVEPVPSGDMPFADGTFDLTLCLGVLHHIPNVSKVVREIGRVSASGAMLLIREPVVSMGDWRDRDHPGLTKRERGIPRHLLEQAVRDAGFTVRSSRFCASVLTSRISRVLGRNLYRTASGARVDRALSLATAWNYRYHPANAWQKLRPSAVYLVAERT
ncbi:class I SAM-dependent methyltransferase [Streptomyces sp. NPDC087440]|uniref:class I SAM-dependent methyltransferase n=1 Tax=Streptomyces sp. NPDC087440 TaxID=3365790 RepID=UPI0038121D71